MYFVAFVPVHKKQEMLELLKLKKNVIVLSCLLIVLFMGCLLQSNTILGEADTILLPVEPVWGAKYPLPGVIRLSVGIENIEKLKGQIGEALGKI